MLEVWSPSLGPRCYYMKYTTKALHAAIATAGLPANHAKALRALVALRRQPLVIGYFIKTIGILLLGLSGYFTYLMLRVAVTPPKIHASAPNGGLDPFLPVISICFWLALFLLAGADHYLNWTRQSRATCELLMKCGKPDNQNKPAGSRDAGSG